ncbi:MAG: polysaccharide pyruvyl transferase CsaB [Armatimonadota bacterium]|nr:polysaccharide pyruvyl transferase CsaB [Armatimonadota bacterium]
MRIVLSGYYGFGNAGDEAVLSAAVTELRRRLPEAELAALSADPRATEDAHGVRAAQRWPPGPLWRAIASADLMLSGGGSLLQDATSLRSLGYYLLTMELARRAGVPYAILSQGLGPLQSWLGRRLAGHYLRGAGAVTVRDQQSADLARTLGVPEALITVGADPGLLLEPASAGEARAILQEAGAEVGRPLTGIVMREWRGAYQALPALAAIGRAAIEQWQAGVVLLPFQVPADLEITHELASLLPHSAVVAEPLHPRALMAVIGQLEMVVAMRLHALVFAAAQAVPALGVAYDPKVAALCRAAEQACAPLEERQRLAELAEETWRSRESQAEVRRRRAVELRQRAARCFDVIERLCQELS